MEANAKRIHSDILTWGDKLKSIEDDLRAFALEQPNTKEWNSYIDSSVTLCKNDIYAATSKIFMIIEMNGSVGQALFIQTKYYSRIRELNKLRDTIRGDCLTLILDALSKRKVDLFGLLINMNETYAYYDLDTLFHHILKLEGSDDVRDLQLFEAFEYAVQLRLS